MSFEDQDLIPDVPGHFCFKKNEFFIDSFDADLFIKKHQNDMPLEQLREDLSIYLRKLRLSLADLINKDYEDFIELTTNYIDLKSGINNLVYSLKILKSDVVKNQENIQLTIDNLNENLKMLKSTQKQKKDLSFILNASKLINYIEEDISKGNLNVNFDKYFYQLNSINQKLLDLTDFNSKYINQVLKPKVNNLNLVLNNYLNDEIDKLLTNCDKQNLIKFLQICALNQQKDIFIDLIFKKIFQDQIQEFICDYNIEKLGVSIFYEKLFQICNNNYQLFEDVNLVNLNEILIEKCCQKIYDNLVINASTLFLAGNPENFIFNFKQTINFFKKLIFSIKSNKQNEIFLKFYDELKEKFNFEIYFHIRLSEISLKYSNVLEKPILIDKSIQKNDLTNQNFKIEIVKQITKLIEFIWSDDIYIETLFFDFWKLTLLIITRYSIFLKNFNLNSISEFKDDLKLSIIICLINESSQLVNSIQKIYISNIKPKINNFCNETELFNCINESFDTLFKIGVPSINELLKNLFYSLCINILEQIKEIPRLYRKTNREVPSKPSNYIISCVDLIKQLKSIQSFSDKLILEIINQVTNLFFNLTNQVLESLQKMEESLMRLKKVQNNQIENSNKKNQTSDADKIRLQFKLDAEFYLLHGIQSFNINLKQIDHLQPLLELVQKLQS